MTAMTRICLTPSGSMVSRALLSTLLASGLAACTSEAPPKAEAAVARPEAPPALNDETAQIFENVETHADVPPHGGEVIQLGNHVAHAEVVLVPDTGEVTVHILDGEGRPGKRIAQPSILVDVETSGRAVRLELKAAPLDGETSGDASRFSALSEELLRTGQARITLRWVLVDGQTFADTVLAFSAS